MAAPAIAAPITAGSTLHEWTAGPVAVYLIREAGGRRTGRPDPDPELVSVIGAVPMSTLAGVGAMSIDHDTLDGVVARWLERVTRR